MKLTRFNRYTWLIGAICCFTWNARLSSDQQDQALMQEKIKHVVVLLLENRSFDNILAWLYSNGENPSAFIPESSNVPYMGLEEGSLDLYTNDVKGSDGNILFSSAPIKGIPSAASTPYLNSPKYDPHEPFPHVINQIYGFDGAQLPNMSGFLQDFATLWWEFEWLSEKMNICAVMETYTQNELPVLYSLAKHYAVSDRWFSSVPTQTNPNRAFAACGTSEGQTVNGPLGQSAFYADTLWNRLLEKSPETSWTIFWQTDMIPGILPGPYCLNNFEALKKIPDVDSHFEKIDSFHDLARKGQLPDYTFIEPQMTTSINLDPRLKSHDPAQMAVKGVILGVQGNDLHPPGDARTCENFLANVYTSLIANEEAWNKTLLVITFDEHGGLFDHVPPPAAIPPDDNFQDGFKFDLYGVRVPAIFISPLINKGTVLRSEDSSLPFDHTSLISTVLKWKQIPKSEWSMGRRVEASPSFDTVIARQDPRSDKVISPEEAAASVKKAADAIRIGDPVCLRCPKGQYIIKSEDWLSTFHPCVGSEEQKTALEFACGAGTVTHGSFVLIKSTDPQLGEGNLLETVLSHWNCSYEKNKHETSQWWTVKSVDHPYLGYPIQYGDRVYLESHVYLNPFEYVPGRLAKREGFFGEYLMTKAVTEKDSENNYWIIERP